MSTPTFELDRSNAAFIATLEVDSPMMKAPEPRWLWSCLRRRRAHWRFRAYRESFLAIRAFTGTNLRLSCSARAQAGPENGDCCQGHTGSNHFSQGQRNSEAEGFWRWE